MDARTKNLVWILVASVFAMTMVLGVSAWFDENARLDAELVSLQKRARLAGSSGTTATLETERAALESRLRPVRELPAAVAFAAQVRESIRRSGLALEDFAVQEDPGKGGTVKAQMTGTMAQWFSFQTDARRAGPLVYRSAVFDAGQGGFHITVVVGYAAHP